MNTQDTNNATTETPTKGKVLIHTRNEAEAETFKKNFDVSKLGDDIRFVHGLLPTAQASMMACAETGRRLISTGLPLDIAASIKEVTVARCWDKVKEDGSRSSGSTPPVCHFASVIVDREAYEALKALPEFNLAFGSGEATEAAF